MKKSIVGILSLVMFFLGCDDLPYYEVIDKLRVLAVRADKPQAAIGETVTMDALVVTPNDRPVSLSWQLCAYSKGISDK